MINRNFFTSNSKNMFKTHFCYSIISIALKYRIPDKLFDWKRDPDAFIVTAAEMSATVQPSSEKESAPNFLISRLLLSIKHQ